MSRINDFMIVVGDHVHVADETHILDSEQYQWLLDYHQEVMPNGWVDQVLSQVGGSDMESEHHGGEEAGK